MPGDRPQGSSGVSKRERQAAARAFDGLAKDLYPCLRVMVSFEEWSYFCALSGAQIKTLKRHKKPRLEDIRTGMAFVDGGENTDWFSVTVSTPADFDSKIRPATINHINGTLSLLKIGDAKIVDLVLPKSYMDGSDCVVEFRSHKTLKKNSKNKETLCAKNVETQRQVKPSGKSTWPRNPPR